MEIILSSIGIIHSSFTDPAQTPIQAARSSAQGWIEILPEFVPGLQDIEGFSHLYLIYLLHAIQEVNLLVKPFLDDQVHGVFATRHPSRPNHLGISVFELISRQENRLDIRGVDVLDGTPLLDIKPFVPEFDLRYPTNIGWYANRKHP